MDTSSVPPPAYLAFDRVAEEYDATRFVPPAVTDAVARRCLEGIGPGDWFLDAGIGTGRFGRPLARRHPQTVGVDISLAMMHQMLRPEVMSRPLLTRADLRRLPFREGVFAGVLVVHIFHLIADWRQAVREVWRALAPGGALFLAVEDGSRTQVREFYLRRATEQAALPPPLGARTDAVLAELAALGGTVTEARAADLRWERVWTAREILGMLERRTYSLLWEVPEEAHARLLAETREWVLRTHGSLDVQERVTTQLLLFEARKP